MYQQFTPPMTNILYRVVEIHGKDFGTGFFVEVDGLQYFVTAAHLIDPSADSIKIFCNGAFNSFPCKILSVSEMNDLAVISFTEEIIEAFPVLLDYGHLGYGQHVFFLGFPFNDRGPVTQLRGKDFPFPFVKWGAVSLLDFGSPTGTLILDAMNNPGFSGGPVCFTTEAGVQKIAGMIIGLKEEERIIEAAEKDTDRIKRYYKQNTGITYAISARVIKEQIRETHGGLPIAS